MISEEQARQKKLEEMLKIVNITDEQLSELDYKSKQKYYKTKNRLVKVHHRSRDVNGNGITYMKKEEE